MKLLIAGKDVSGTMGVDIAAAAAERARVKSPRFHVPEVSALSLVKCRNEDEYLAAFMKLMRMRHGASTDDFDIQRSPSFVGGVMKRVRHFLWKLLVYQHDRMIFQQNLINEMLIHALEFEAARRDREIGDLKREIAALREAAGKEKAGQ